MNCVINYSIVCNHALQESGKKYGNGVNHPPQVKSSMLTRSDVGFLLQSCGLSKHMADHRVELCGN